MVCKFFSILVGYKFVFFSLLIYFDKIWRNKPSLIRVGLYLGGIQVFEPINNKKNNDLNF